MFYVPMSTICLKKCRKFNLVNVKFITNKHLEKKFCGEVNHKSMGVICFYLLRNLRNN